MTREARTGPTQDVTRSSSRDDIGDDVVMREDNANENRAEQPEFVGVKQQKKDHHEEGTT